MRILVLCLSLALATACKKAPPEQVSPTPEATVATPTAVDDAPAAAEELPVEAEPANEEPEETADVGEYGDDDEVIVTRIDASMLEPFLAYRAAADAVGPSATNEGGREQLNEKISAARAKSGLSDREAEALGIVMNEVLVSVGEGATEAGVASDARQKYGDEVVDAMLARIGTLKKLEGEEDALAQTELAEFAKTKRKMLLMYATLQDMDGYAGDDWAYFVDEVEAYFKKKHPKVALGAASDGSLSPALANHLVRKVSPEGMGYLFINGDRSMFFPHSPPEMVIGEAKTFFGF